MSRMGASMLLMLDSKYIRLCLSAFPSVLGCQPSVSPTEWYLATKVGKLGKIFFLQMGAGAVNIIMLPSLLIPVTWFPEHKGLVGFNTKSITINDLGQAQRLQ